MIKDLYFKDIYEKAGLAHQIFSPDVPTDVFHLNDVQPIRNDKNHVVLLSLRNQSNIIAFDLVNEKYYGYYKDIVNFNTTLIF